MIQRWWRRLLRRYQHQSKMIFSEDDLIQTVLRKYETLQRQSQSLVYNFTERKLRHSECEKYDSLENINVPNNTIVQRNVFECHPEKFTFQDSVICNDEEEHITTSSINLFTTLEDGRL